MTTIQRIAATRDLMPSGSGCADQNPSIIAATKSIAAAPSASSTATRPRSFSASARERDPGATMAWPRMSPPAPATTIAVNSKELWPQTKPRKRSP
jgi:hypothetical protein